jgi:hypothetical protein
VLHVESPQSVVAQIDEFIEHMTHKPHCE